MASTLFKTGSSNPLIELVYGTNNWFQEEYWDFTKVESIPNNAFVEAVGIQWTIANNSRINDSNIYIALFNENGNGDWLDSGILNFSFRGEPAKQMWTTNFLITHPLTEHCYISPTLTLTWYDPESQQSGTCEVSSSKRRHFTEANSLKTKKLPERKIHSMKIDSSPSNHHVSHKFYNPLASKWLEENSAPSNLKRLDEFVKSDSSIILDAEPTELVNNVDNSMTILKGVSYSLGIINGKPLQALLMEGGGIDTNFRPKIFKKVDSDGHPTCEQLDSLEIKLSYSKEEHNEAQRRTSVLSVLFDIASGKLTTDYFNESQYSRHFEDFAANIGLDLNAPFLLNGKQFEFSNGELSAGVR